MSSLWITTLGYVPKCRNCTFFVAFLLTHLLPLLFQVIEFVDDCEALISFINYGANALRYYPNEPTGDVCRAHMEKEFKVKNPSSEKKRKAFDEILERKSPIFRYFFVENFGHSLEHWHTAKLRYTRSVAVNSMVGHILGIGT